MALEQFLLAAVAALALGLGIGALLWAGPLGRMRTLLGETKAELAGAAARLGELEPVRSERDDAARRLADAERTLAALMATAEERERSFEEQKAGLIAAGDALKAEFQRLAAEALKGNQTQFLEVAEEAIKRQREAADAELKTNKQALAEMLTPVSDTLKRYEDGLKQLESARTEAYGGLKEQIETMRVETIAVRGETAKLANVLRASPKARGRWGEMALRNVLERAGLSEHCDFAREVSVDTDSGRLRPDVVVRMPGGRQLIIDAKCAFNAYEDAANASDDAERQTHLKAHAQSMRRHAEQLGRKAYWDQFEDAPDYVVMFVSGEQFLSAAMEADPALWEDAFEKRVLMAGPMHLVGIARTVAAVWRQERLALEAAEMGAAARELYERIATMGEHVRKLGGGLKSSVDNYNAFVGSLETKVLPKARAIRAMNIEPPKQEIPELVPVEAIPRTIAAPELLAPPRSEAAE